MNAEFLAGTQKGDAGARLAFPAGELQAEVFQQGIPARWAQGSPGGPQSPRIRGHGRAGAAAALGEKGL